MAFPSPTPDRRRVIVTGATGGIGRAITATLTHTGTAVAACDRPGTGAQVGLARTLAGEWGPRGVRCNVVMPGMIATPKVTGMPDSLKDAIARTIPLRRFGEPDELAGVVSFLLSPAAAYLNGAVIRVDGGFGLASGSMTAR
jgi:NAD(P)-dependent dehydrogenase (short-subunit alcohol dehydrogenase family)